MTTINEKFAGFFGPKLLRSSSDQNFKTVETLDALKNKKAICLYFSAHWCPPCRGFTPKLVEWYKAHVKQGFEMVFLSSDHDEAAFNEYFAEMPWFAVPYHERELKNKASQRLGVQGIPFLVVLDPMGKIITTEGRRCIMEKPDGFPWVAPALKDILKPETEFLRSPMDGGPNKKFENLDADVLGLYFSAHWCPPCCAFTPKLVEVYKELEKARKDVEIIFISSDRDEEAFKDYHATMPWLALPYAERELKSQLSSHFEVEGIPTLIMLDKDLKIINSSAVGSVQGDGAVSKFPWLPEAVNEVDENPEGIDEYPSLVVLQDRIDESLRKANTAVITGMAEAQAAKEQADAAPEGEVANVFDEEKEKSVKFFLASAQGRLGDKVRSECRVPDDKELHIVLLDIQNSGSFYRWDSSKDLTKENLEAFLADFRANQLAKKKMGADSREEEE